MSIEEMVAEVCWLCGGYINGVRYTPRELRATLRDAFLKRNTHYMVLRLPDGEWLTRFERDPKAEGDVAFWFDIPETREEEGHFWQMLAEGR